MRGLALTLALTACSNWTVRTNVAAFVASDVALGICAAECSPTWAQGADIALIVQAVGACVILIALALSDGSIVGPTVPGAHQ